MMSTQDQLILTTLETIYHHGLAGVQNEESRAFGSRVSCSLSSPTPRQKRADTKMSDDRGRQSYFQAQSFNAQPTQEQDEFLDSDKLFHPQSQISS